MRNRRNKRNNSIKNLLITKKRLLLAIILIIIICLSIFIIKSRQEQTKAILVAQRKELEEQTEEIFKDIEKPYVSEEKTLQTTTAKIAAVGDILCGTDMLADAKDGDTYKFDYMFEGISKLLIKSDIAVGTLETNFTDEAYSGVGKYNSPIEFLKAVKKSGINLVSLAHNHVLDYGEEGLNKTIERIKEQGISTTGIKNNTENTDENFTGIIKEVRRIKIAILSYTYGLSNESKISEDEKAIANIYSEEKVKHDIDYAKENSNFIIVVMHWGEVNKSTISQWQKDVRDYLIENGVDLILGSHPSVIEPMEMIKTEDEKNILVAYSLGNYISSLKYENADVELVLNIEIQKEPDAEKAILKKVDYTPIYVLDNGIKAENRFELVDMKGLALDYANGNTDKITKATYNKIVKKLEWLNKLIVK